MRLTHIFAALMIGPAFCASGAAGEQTFYSREVCGSVDHDAIRKSVADSLARLREELPAAGRLVREAEAEKHIFAGCFARRLEIIRRLGAYLEGLQESAEPDALLFARQGAGELVQLLAYFREAGRRMESRKTAQPEKIINVKEFGAKGDGLRDDAPAFARAVAEARKSGGRVKLFVPAGTYLFGSYEAKRTFPADAGGWRIPRPDFSAEHSGPDHLHVPQIVGMKEFTIEGEAGTVLLGANPRVGFFLFRRCSYLTVRNLVFDYRQLPFTQGVITEVDHSNGIVRMKPDDGFPAPDLDYILEANSLYGITYNADGTRRIKDSSFKRFSGVRDSGNGFYDLRIANRATRGLVPGYRFAINARYNSGNAHILRGFFCDNTLFEGVTVHAAPANVYGGLYLDNHAVVNCRIMPPPGSKRLLACNADPCMVGGAKIGAYLANNIFEYAGDDVANQYVEGQQVKSVSGDGLSVTVPFGTFGPGHIVSLIDPNDGMIKGEAVVEAYEAAPGGGMKLTLRTPFSSGVLSMDSLKQKAMSAAEAHTFTSLQSNIRTGLFPFVVMDRHYTGSGTVISNNVFRNSYRGVLTKVSNMMLDGNTIEGMDREGESIMVYANHWREPNPAHTVVIRNNIFRDNGGGIGCYYQIYSTKTAPGLTPLRDILVENNVFENTLGSGFDNCRDVRIIGNRFGLNSWLSFGISRNVSVEGNSFVLPRAQALKVGTGAKELSIGTNGFAQ